MNLLASQHWVAHSKQLVDLGVSQRAISRAVRDGSVCRILSGVVGLPRHSDALAGRAMALHLAGDRRGYVSGMAAGTLYGLRQMNSGLVEYTIASSTSLRAPRWAKVIRSSWPDDEPRPPRQDGLVLVSPLRLLLDLAGRLPPKRFERAAEDAWQRELVTPQAAAHYLARVRRSGRCGVHAMERWLDHALAQERPATTGLEQLLVDLARRAGLPSPHRQYELRLLNGILIHLDVAWPQMKLAIEPGHSWWHGGAERQRADQERDRKCGELGWLVLRYDESVWKRQSAAVGEIRRTYDQRTTLFAHRPIP